MENNPELQLAWQFIENTGTHLFLTGKAGTGKTTFLKRLREHTPNAWSYWLRRVLQQLTPEG